MWTSEFRIHFIVQESMMQGRKFCVKFGGGEESILLPFGVFFGGRPNRNVNHCHRNKRSM